MSVWYWMALASFATGPLLGFLALKQQKRSADYKAGQGLIVASWGFIGFGWLCFFMGLISRLESL